MTDTEPGPLSPTEGTPPRLVRPNRIGRPEHPVALWGAAALALGLLGVASLGPTRAFVGWAMIPWTVAFLGLIVLQRSQAAWLDRGVVLLGGSLVLRVLFLLTDPDLSDDLYRYVWDGWIRLEGIRPYRWPPDDPALEAFQGDLLFEAMNSPSWISVYPPLSQLVFLIGGWIHANEGWPASAMGLRVAFTTLEFGGIVALHFALRALQVRPARLLLYAWNPLPLLVVAGSGHSEGGLVLGLGLLVFGLAGWRPGVAWIGWVLAVLSKGIPLLLGPLLLRNLMDRVGLKRALIGMLPAGVLALALSAPFLHPTDLPRIASSVRLYSDFFSFNGALHPLVRSLGWRFLGIETGPWLARLFVVATLGAALLVALGHRTARSVNVATVALGLMTLYLLLTPTVHPWYLLWALPFLPMATPRMVAPWLWMSWAALATYLFYGGVSGTHLALLFWGGALLLALRALPINRERVLAPLRRIAGVRKARWIRPWIAGPRVLDVGGAEGHVIDALSPPHEGWVVDPEAVLPGHVRAPGEALPFKDDSVDTVVLSFVLHHAKDPRRVLGEALRTAGRRVVILESVPRSPRERRWLEGLDRWVNAHRGVGGMGRPEAPLAMQPADYWTSLARDLGAQILHAGRPGGLHPVLLLVLEPSPLGKGSVAVDRPGVEFGDAS
jgi:alpha-1,6-mannosyltransferase